MGLVEGRDKSVPVGFGLPATVANDLQGLIATAIEIFINEKTRCCLFTIRLGAVTAVSRLNSFSTRTGGSMSFRRPTPLSSDTCYAKRISSGFLKCVPYETLLTRC